MSNQRVVTIAEANDILTRYPAGQEPSLQDAVRFTNAAVHSVDCPECAAQKGTMCWNEERTVRVDRYSQTHMERSNRLRNLLQGKV